MQIMLSGGVGQSSLRASARAAAGEELVDERREEAIKFTPSYADRGDRLAVKGSTAKGGRPREVPVLTHSQRRPRAGRGGGT